MNRRRFLKLLGSTGLASLIPVGLIDIFSSLPVLPIKRKLVNDGENFQIGDVYTIDGVYARTIEGKEMEHLQQFLFTGK